MKYEGYTIVEGLKTGGCSRCKKKRLIRVILNGVFLTEFQYTRTQTAKERAIKKAMGYVDKHKIGQVPP